MQGDLNKFYQTKAKLSNDCLLKLQDILNNIIMSDNIYYVKNKAFINVEEVFPNTNAYAKI